MAAKKVDPKVVQQKKVNNGDAINKRIIEKGRAINQKKNEQKNK